MEEKIQIALQIYLLCSLYIYLVIKEIKSQ